HRLFYLEKGEGYASDTDVFCFREGLASAHSIQLLDSVGGVQDSPSGVCGAVARRGVCGRRSDFSAVHLFPADGFVSTGSPKGNHFLFGSCPPRDRIAAGGVLRTGGLGVGEGGALATGESKGGSGKGGGGSAADHFLDGGGVHAFPHHRLFDL